MAIIKAKLRELRDGDVRYISLVDRAATRLPFRVLKQDKESAMGIDLTGVFKRDQAIKIFNVAVLAQKSEATTALVRGALEQAGFRTNLVMKAEGDVLLYKQNTVPAKDPVMVRLSDQVIIDVEGMGQPQGFMAEVVKECGFLPSLPFASAEMTERVTAAVAKGDLGVVPTLISELEQYTQLLATLPDAVFKLDEAVRTVLHTSAEKMDTKDEPDQGKDEATESDAEKAKEQAEVKKKAAKKTEATTTTKADKKKAKPTKDDEADEDPAEEDSESADEEAAEDADEPDEKDKKKSYKAEESSTAILTALTALTSKVEGVVQTQTAQQALLDGVVKKTDALNDTLKTTVTAPAGSTDRTRDTHSALKVDSDPRTGFFDTAFMPRTARRR